MSITVMWFPDWQEYQPYSIRTHSNEAPHFGLVFSVWTLYPNKGTREARTSIHLEY